MPGKQKSEWSKTLAELKDKAQLPKGVDARSFRNCRVNGVLDRPSVAKVCDEKGCKDKVDAIIAFLKHLAEKPAGATDNAQDLGPEEAKLMLKSTYKKLTFDDFEKLIPMLTKMQADSIEQALEQSDANMEKEGMRNKYLKAKKAALAKK